MKQRYFETELPITNEELYDMIANWVDSKELQRNKFYSDGKLPDFFYTKTYYSEGVVEVYVNKIGDQPAIEIWGNRDRNIDSVVKRLTILLKLNEFGGLVEVQEEQRVVA